MNPLTLNTTFLSRGRSSNAARPASAAPLRAGATAQANSSEDGQSDAVTARRAERLFARQNARMARVQGRVQGEIAQTMRLLSGLATSSAGGSSASNRIAAANDRLAASSADLKALETFMSQLSERAADGEVSLGGLDLPETVRSELRALEDATRPDELTYLVNDGFGIIDAEQFTANNAGQNGFDWVVDSTGERVIAVEQAGTSQFTDATDIKANAGRLDYKVNFEEAGTYQVWVRGRSTTYGDTNSNSVNIGLNGEVMNGSGGVEVGTWGFSWGNTETFTDVRVTIEVEEPGLQTFNMWVREDGTQVDAVLITKDAAYTSPSGVQGLSVSDITTTPGAAGPVSLSQIEAIVTARREALQTEIEAAQAQILAAAKQSDAGANPYLQAVLDAQERGLSRLAEREEQERTRFVEAYRARTALSGKEPYAYRLFDVNAGADTTAQLTISDLIASLSLDKSA